MDLMTLVDSFDELNRSRFQVPSRKAAARPKAESKAAASMQALKNSRVFQQSYLQFNEILPCILKWIEIENIEFCGIFKLSKIV